MSGSTSLPRQRGPRQVVFRVVAALVIVYAVLVAGGYAWVYFGLKNHRISFVQLALFRWADMRRDMAAQQLADARRALAARNYEAAYLGFSSAVRNDPANIDCRLAAADFFASVGVPKVAAQMLEDGLQRNPTDPRLLERTLRLLTSSGADGRALELLHDKLAGQLGSGANAPMLQSYDVLATLNTEGGEAARRQVDHSPNAALYPPFAAIRARVDWENGNRFDAVHELAAWVASGAPDFGSFQLLANWQLAIGLGSDAVATAERACATFPSEWPPRLLKLSALAGVSAGIASSEFQQAFAAYLQQAGQHPDAVAMVAELAGRKGWVDLAHALYEAAALRGQNAALLALYYSDALAAHAQWQGTAAVLSEVGAQIPDNSKLAALLRERQVVAAAEAGDHDAARGFARRLALALSGDSDALASRRRRFAALHIPEAVAELAAASTPAK